MSDFSRWKPFPPPETGMYGLKDTQGKISVGKYDAVMNHCYDRRGRSFTGCRMFAFWRHPSARDVDIFNELRNTIEVEEDMGDWQSAK